MTLDHDRILKRIFAKGIVAVSGYGAVRSAVRITSPGIMVAGRLYSYKAFNRVVVIGAGKASFDMARGLEKVIGSRIDEGLVITKYGHGGRLKHIGVFEAAHPLPDKNGVAATRRLLALADGIDRRTLVIMLLSGGASALLVAPDGVLLRDKIKVTSLLLKAGASIDELNAVRKQLSKVKGGRLAGAFYPATMVTLIISDVVGNRLDVIGSGPTVPDTSTPKQALDIIGRYGLEGNMPAAIMEQLLYKTDHAPTRVPPSRARNIIIADNRKAVHACAEGAARLGLRPFVLTTTLRGEAREVAHVLSSIATGTAGKREKGGKGVCLISGGETTVTVKGAGKGGRNQELALSFAMDIAGEKGITLLSAGTDGTDGPTDAAGAVVDGRTIDRMLKAGMVPARYLSNNDSYTALDKVGALLKTGPTGTNVMDIQLILIPPLKRGFKGDLMRQNLIAC